MRAPHLRTQCGLQVLLGTRRSRGAPARVSFSRRSRIPKLPVVSQLDVLRNPWLGCAHRAPSHHLRPAFAKGSSSDLPAQPASARRRHGHDGPLRLGLERCPFS